MGQRFQIYVQVENPIKEFSPNPEAAEKIDLLSIFGKGEKTILAFYHQWLYGSTAVSVAFNLLEFLSKNKEFNQTDDFNYLAGPRFAYNKSLQEFSDSWRFLLGIIRDNVNKKQPGRLYRIEHFDFLNTEDSIYRKCFDRCDNNDGILIVDALTLKYCFTIIPDGDRNIYLKPYRPVSAADYFRSYYPDEETEMITEKFSPFELLTVVELKTIFPAMAGILDKYNSNLVPNGSN